MTLTIYLHIPDVFHHSFLLIFVEFLHLNGVKIPTIRNYLSAVKQYFLLYSFPTDAFQYRCLQMLMRSISINASYTPRLKRVLTIDILKNLFHLCDTLVQGSMYTAIFLVAFFDYLHLSSLVPSSKFYKFQLQRSYFSPHSLGMSLTLPQTKMHQHYDQMHSVVLPRFYKSVLCPVTAVAEMFARILALPSDIAFGY